jgi:uncharacterized membrane protein YqiK
MELLRVELAEAQEMSKAHRLEVAEMDVELSKAHRLEMAETEAELSKAHRLEMAEMEASWSTAQAALKKKLDGANKDSLDMYRDVLPDCPPVLGFVVSRRA